MTSSARVLILDEDPDVLTHHSAILERHGSNVVAETATTISDALQRLGKAGFDAVVCRVETPEEVSFLIRIRNAAPKTPIVAVTSGTNPALDDLARESGADAVQMVTPGPTETLEPAALRIRRLIQQSQAAVRRSRELRLVGRELVAERRRIISRNRLFSRQRLDQIKLGLQLFVPLLVEDSAEQAMLMRRAFGKASLPFSLPVMTDGEQAIDYLAGTGIYADREKYRLPTLMILDLNLPRKSGFEVIQWIRTRSEFARFPVYMLTSSHEDLERAMELGMNDYFTKPMSFDVLVDIVCAIATRWWFYTEACALAGR